MQDDDLLAQEEVVGDQDGTGATYEFQEDDHGGSRPTMGMAGRGADLDEARFRGGWTFCSAKAGLT